jgi:hypothetical protein
MSNDEKEWTTGSSNSSETSPTSRCELPPLGWRCSRAKGHEGPCAARPLEELQVEQKIAKAHEEIDQDYFVFGTVPITVEHDDLRGLLNENQRARAQVTELQKRGTELLEEVRAARRQARFETELDTVCEAVRDFLFTFRESVEKTDMVDAVDKLSDVIDPWIQRKFGRPPAEGA